MTVGPGITPGLLTLPSITIEVVFAAKRSRAMRIARNYRRWGIAPRPENVFAALSRAAQRFYHRLCVCALRLSDDCHRIFCRLETTFPCARLD
jgi:hypothetical protein